MQKRNPAAGGEARSQGPPAVVRERWALASLSLSLLLTSAGTSIVNVALPTLAAAFSATFQQVQWLVLAYLLAITTLIVSVGRLGDLIGRRRLLLAGLLFFSSASALCGFAPTLAWLIAGRAAQGIGAAIVIALSVAMVGDTVPPAGIGRAMGQLGATSAIGTALGPSLGGMLVAAFGWQSIFLVNSAIGVAALLLSHRFLPRAQHHQGRLPIAFDPLGTVLLALTLGAYALALTLGRGHFGAVNGALLVTAALGGGAFAFVEARVASPLVNLAAFRNHRLTSGLAMSVIVSTVTMTTLVVGPFYLARALGLDAARTGLVIAAGPLAAALTGFPAGRLVDRFGSALIRRLGLIPMGIGCLLLATLPEALGVAGYVVPLVVLTIGDALFQTANMTAVLGGVQADQRGVTSGLLNLSRNLGLVTGASLMGAVFARASSASDIASAPPGAVAHGTRITFAVAAVFIVIASILAAGAHRSSQAPNENGGT